MNVNAVAAAGPIMPETKGEQQSFEIAKRDRCPTLHHTIEDFIGAGHGQRLMHPRP